LVSESIIRTIADDLNATTVLIGTTKKLDESDIQLSAHMVSVRNPGRVSHSAEVSIFTPPSSVDLSPWDGLDPLPPITSTSRGETVFHVGGISRPQCTYMPNPPYSEEARKLKLNGSLQLEGVIGMDGKLDNLRIVRGLPAGLNDIAIETAKTWRCNPALKDGKPVPVVVQFEVNFRLY
jgi:TonB family protein